MMTAARQASVPVPAARFGPPSTVPSAVPKPFKPAFPSVAPPPRTVRGTPPVGAESATGTAASSKCQRWSVAASGE